MPEMELRTSLELLQIKTKTRCVPVRISLRHLDVKCFIEDAFSHFAEPVILRGEIEIVLGPLLHCACAPKRPPIHKVFWSGDRFKYLVEWGVNNQVVVDCEIAHFANFVLTDMNNDLNAITTSNYKFHSKLQRMYSGQPIQFSEIN